jgi:hypothetical protein
MVYVIEEISSSNGFKTECITMFLIRGTLIKIRSWQHLLNRFVLIAMSCPLFITKKLTYEYHSKVKPNSEDNQELQWSFYIWLKHVFLFTVTENNIYCSSFASTRFYCGWECVAPLRVASISWKMSVWIDTFAWANMFAICVINIVNYWEFPLTMTS